MYIYITSQPKDFNRLVMQYAGVIHLHTITQLLLK